MALLNFRFREVAAPAAPEPRVAAPQERGPAPPGADLRAARAGDRAAFARLVREHQALVFGVALRICGQRADAEELAQDAFLQLHDQLATLSDERHLRHWLMRAVSHRAIDRLRHDGRRPAASGAELPESIPAATAEEDPLLAAALARLMAELAGPARAVLALRFQEDLDPTEISAVLDMPLNTVKSHLRRSLEWLRDAAPELRP